MPGSYPAWIHRDPDKLPVERQLPSEVARFALQNAASVAGLMLTTAGMVAELPKDEKGGGGMGGMGGMGDMDM